ncbi:MAG: glycosyltransferase family 39 protein [Candidatus Omnitrophica bacterium]|nr:glycosyltransferase family 39 protein [Candidatus Omnitrophota bacterium]
MPGCPGPCYDGPMNGRLTLVAVVVLILAGTALRARVGQEIPYDSDEAIAGLMARNIAFEGEAPIFLYGESYVGSATQFVVAGLFRAVGFSPAILRWPEYALTAILLWLGFLIARMHGGLEAGLWTLLLLALPPVFLTVLNLKCWGNYNETYCLGGALWLLTLAIRERQGEPKSATWGAFLAWGFLFGLGFWIHFPILIYALPCMAILACILPARAWLVNGPLLGVGFLIGWGPALAYNLSNGFSNLGYAAKGSWDYLTRLEQSGPQLIRLVERGLPFLLGAQSDTARFIDFRQFDPLFAKVAVLGGFGFLVVLYLRRCERAPNNSTGNRLLGWIPIGMILLTLLAAMYGRWGGGAFTPRYYSFLYLPLFVIAGQGLAWCRERFASITFIWAGFLLFVHLYGHVTLVNHPPPRTAEKLVAFLEERRISAVFTDYWIAHPVTFLTNEKVIGSVHGGPVRHERYPRYSQMAEQAETVAYALYRDMPEGPDEVLRRELRGLEVTWEETPIENLTVFHHLSRKVTPGEMRLHYRY